MRRIVTQEIREKKETRNKVIIGVILVGLMVLSVAGYAFYNTGNESVDKVKYNNLEFVLKDDGLWHVTIQDYEFSTQYTPAEIENISINLNFNLNNYGNKPLYFSSGSDSRVVNEVARNLNPFVERIQYTCLQGEECEQEDLPVKNCTDNNIIIIKEQDVNIVKQEENCVYILADYFETVRAADAFIFRLLGVA